VSERRAFDSGANRIVDGVPYPVTYYAADRIAVQLVVEELGMNLLTTKRTVSGPTAWRIEHTVRALTRPPILCFFIKLHVGFCPLLLTP